LKFNDNMRQFVPPEQLWTEFQGDLDFEYDHEVYWPALIKMCEEKHAELKARWIRAGKNYGESEVYLKGGDTLSITGLKPDERATLQQTEGKGAELVTGGPDTGAIEKSSDTEGHANKGDEDTTTEKVAEAKEK
jgi:hypothetical protein